MTVSLKIEVTSPLTDDDRDLLAGLAVMTVAIANRQIQQEEAPQPEEPPTLETLQAWLAYARQEGKTIEAAAIEQQIATLYPPQPCGALEYVHEPSGDEATGKVCTGIVGHGGRHRFRQPELQTNTVGMN